MISRLSKSLGVGIALFTLLVVFAQGQTRSKSTAAPQKTAVASGLAVDDIVKMSKAGLGDGIIVQQIRKNGKAFDLTPDQMIQLKVASVSDRVISVMMDPSAPDAVAPVAAPVAQDATSSMSTDPDNPASPHDPGVYMYIKERGVPRMILIEPTFYSQGKTGGMFAQALTYGIAKVKTKAVVPGAHASLRSSDSAVSFYFYFESTGAKAFGGSSTPSEYTLVKFDVAKNSRQTVTMEANVFGASHGTEEKANTGFNSSKLSPGVFKVSPSAPLAPGEYCFLYSTGEAGTAAAHRLYAFGISTPETQQPLGQ